MTEDEAVGILHQQLVSDAGFLAQLHTRGSLDDVGIAHLRQAISILTLSWSASVSVPKRAVFALAHFESLESLIERYPDLHLGQLYSELSAELEICLNPGEWAIAEWWIGHEGAERTLVEEFLSEDGLLMRLHGRQGIHHEGAERIREAIQSICAQSHAFSLIHKALAFVLVMAPDLIRGRWGIYRGWPSMQQEILAFGDDLGRQIRSCLRDEPAYGVRQMKMDLAE
jgi:hypothetical protein